MQVKIAYVNFVNHCYVDTEVEMKEIYTSNHIWKLFDSFTVDMARVSPLMLDKMCVRIKSFINLVSLKFQVCSNREKRMSDPVLEKYVIQVVLDTINAFFSSPFSENSTSTEVRHHIYYYDSSYDYLSYLRHNSHISGLCHISLYLL